MIPRQVQIFNYTEREWMNELMNGWPFISLFIQTCVNQQRVSYLEAYKDIYWCNSFTICICLTTILLCTQCPPPVNPDIVPLLTNQNCVLNAERSPTIWAIVCHLHQKEFTYFHIWSRILHFPGRFCWWFWLLWGCYHWCRWLHGVGVLHKQSHFLMVIVPWWWRTHDRLIVAEEVH